MLLRMAMMRMRVSLAGYVLVDLLFVIYVHKIIAFV